VTPGALVATVLAAALVGGAVAAGVTVAVLRAQSRTNPQNVSLGSNVTINEQDATTQVAHDAQPAVVSIVTDPSSLSHGTGFLVTSDGYIVTNVGVIANAQTLAVLLGTDGKRHDARLVDYDCTTGVAVLKVDRVSSLPTLALDTSGSLVPGQTVIVVPGAFAGAAGVTRGVIGSVHGMLPITVSWGPGQAQMSDVIQTDARVDAGASGAPLLNVGGQVIGVDDDRSQPGAAGQLRAARRGPPAGDRADRAGRRPRGCRPSARRPPTSAPASTRASVWITSLIWAWPGPQLTVIGSIPWTEPMTPRVTPAAPANAPGTTITVWPGTRLPEVSRASVGRLETRSTLSTATPVVQS